MLREDPSRIGADGRDTIALHLAVNKRNLATLYAGCSRTASMSMPSGPCGTAITRRCT